MTAPGYVSPGTPLEAALRYAARGWPVFPIHTPIFLADDDGLASCSCGKRDCGKQLGKHPRTANGLKDAATNESTIRGWWEKWPDANIGIATGGALFVVDIDKGGGKTLIDLELANSGLPPTYTVQSGSGAGRHLYFRLPLGVTLRNSQGTATAGLGPKIDTRGDGGYIIAPPSVHQSGGRYQVLADRDLAETPGWLLERLREKPKPTATPRPFPRTTTTDEERARKYVAKMPEAIEGSGGSLACFKVAVVLVRGFNLPEETVFRILVEDYNPRCQPEWPEKELRHKISDAARVGEMPWGFLLDAKRPGRSAPLLRATTDAAPVTGEPAWLADPFLVTHTNVSGEACAPALRALVERLVNFGVRDDTVRAVAEKANASRCTPPLDAATIGPLVNATPAQKATPHRALEGLLRAHLTGLVIDPRTLELEAVWSATGELLSLPLGDGVDELQNAVMRKFGSLGIFAMLAHPKARPKMVLEVLMEMQLDAAERQTNDEDSEQVQLVDAILTSDMWRDQKLANGDTKSRPVMVVHFEGFKRDYGVAHGRFLGRNDVIVVNFAKLANGFLRQSPQFRLLKSSKLRDLFTNAPGYMGPVSGEGAGAIWKELGDLQFHALDLDEFRRLTGRESPNSCPRAPNDAETPEIQADNEGAAA